MSDEKIEQEIKEIVIVETDGLIATFAWLFFWVSGIAMSPINFTGGIIFFSWWACLIDAILFPMPAWYTTGNQWFSCVFNPPLRMIFDFWKYSPAIIKQMQIVFLGEPGQGADEERPDILAEAKKLAASEGRDATDNGVEE